MLAFQKLHEIYLSTVLLDDGFPALQIYCSLLKNKHIHVYTGPQVVHTCFCKLQVLQIELNTWTRVSNSEDWT